MIGLSVSLCIRSILKGEIKEKDVEKIIGGTSCATEAVWEKVINAYKGSYWQDFPKKAEKLVRKLLLEGRIEQPCLGENPRSPIVYNGIWVKSEDEIEWRDKNKPGQDRLKYKRRKGMNTFVCVLGFLVACVGVAIVANSFKPPFGPLGVLLIVVGAFIAIKKLTESNKKGRKGLC